MKRKFRLFVRLMGILLSPGRFNDGIFELLVAALPKLTRKDLVGGKPRKAEYLEVEPPYEYRLEIPRDPISRARFSHLCGDREVAPFFAVTLQDVRLIGPWGIPVTRKGQVVVESIGVDWISQAVRLTVLALGPAETLRQYLLALFPWFEDSSGCIPIAAHLIPRTSAVPGSAHFGHWVAENLPQIRAIRAVQKLLGATIPVLINSTPAPWQIDLLSILSVQSSDVIPVNFNGQRVTTLVISSLRNVHSRAMEVDSRARRWLVNEFRDAVNSE